MMNPGRRRARQYDLMMGALCLFREARGVPPEQMLCVWWAILNRVNDPWNRWPKYISDVVTEPEQFSSFNPTDPNSHLFPSRRYSEDWGAFMQCLWIVAGPLGADPTHGANFYHTIPDGEPYPIWADPAKLTLELGPFKFYRL
jgi:N-acetylmuramoyl-L-alanine amidase